MGKRTNVVIGALLVCLYFSGELFAQGAKLRNAEALILKGAYPQAIKECKTILTHHHRATVRAKAYYLSGVCLLKEQGYKDARDNFQAILRKHPSSKYCDEAMLGIADSYFLAADFKQASKQYARFLRKFPHSELVSVARMHLEQSKEGRHFANSYFSVQVGCFASKGNAEKLRNELIDRGFQAYILEYPSDNLLRVRVGKYDNRLQAEFLEQKLKVEGFSTKV